MGFVHRDVKPGNVLVFSHKRCFKLCDFGLSTVAPIEMDDSAFQSEPLSGGVVTRYYRAPEVIITRGAYDAGVDVWAAACTIYEALYATGPKPRVSAHRFLFAGATARGGPTDPAGDDEAREHVCAREGQLAAIAAGGALCEPFDVQKGTEAEQKHMGPTLDAARAEYGSVPPLRTRLTATIGIEEEDADALIPMLEPLPSRRTSCARLATLPYFSDDVPVAPVHSWAELTALVG
jgi:serine/threonine protein kinase